MTPEQFAYWLQGLVELWASIKEHLATVLVRENSDVVRHDPNGCRRITELAPDKTKSP